MSSFTGNVSERLPTPCRHDMSWFLLSLVRGRQRLNTGAAYFTFTRRGVSGFEVIFTDTRVHPWSPTLEVTLTAPGPLRKWSPAAVLPTQLRKQDIPTAR